MADELEPYRLLQVFLSTRGAFEVSVLPNAAGPGAATFHCTCPGFSTRGKCKHLSYVQERWDAEDGYIVEMPEGVDLPEPDELSDPLTWRMFVLEHAPVVVLPIKEG